MTEGNSRPLGGSDRWPDASLWPDAVIEETYVDPFGLVKFWEQWYLDGFVNRGQGKVKCLVGRPGAGKTHVLRYLSSVAGKRGFQVARVDVSDIKVAAIDDLYREVATQINWDVLLSRILVHVIQNELGYPEFDRDPASFISWGESIRQLTPNFLRRDLREAINKHFQQVDWYSDFAMAVRSWILDHVSDNPLGGSAEVAWLRGEKLGASHRKSMGTRSNINRRNARLCLGSLASLAHVAFGQGLIVLVDNVEVMASSTRVENRPYYTRGSRDQAYEMFRQLIDESPLTPYLMTILCGDEDPLSGSQIGFPSYPALWARLETEIHSDKPNLFADWVSLDALWEQDAVALDALRERWLRISADWWVDADGNPSGTMQPLGLEWGRPRRMIAELWTEASVKGGDAW